MHNKEKIKWYGFQITIIVVVFVIGIYAGYSHRPWIDRVFAVANKDPQGIVTEADFSPFWKTWNIINEKYPHPDKVTDQERVWGAISGLVGSLNDPYSVFFSPTEAKEFENEITGEFTGVGMEVGIKDKILTVISPLKGTPAEKAGIKAGDKILKIDNTVTNDLTVDKAIKLIRGEKGTTVSLTIYREGVKEPLEIKIVRDVINIPTIESKTLPGGIYVISLYNFNANATDLFHQEILKFKQSGSTKLVLDLRGNPGGYLDAAVDMASWFLPSGKVIVKEDYGDKKPGDEYRSKGYNIFDSKLKMAILVDNGSASASEILAGALSEHGVAKLIGTQTFGKGSVQELVPVTPETYVKITVAKWLTPNGISISEKGLTPDIAVKLDSKNPKKDTQLDRAVQFLTTGK